ncbi:MAG: ATP-binding protein [bacterium]
MTRQVAERQHVRAAEKGRLRIGDDWNAITIIALSQNNPLKAVAEFVENSIDAQAQHITITRGREKGEHYLRIVDDGQGVPRDENGLPNFRYVATHVCDSIKRRLKSGGAEGVQGEYGIGLLSFWTVGEHLALTSGGADGRSYQMLMQKGRPDYQVIPRRTLLPHEGTALEVKPLLPGLRQLSGEKIQWYLAAELRDRIRQSGVKIRVLDRQARKEYDVAPRQFSGRLLHQLPPAAASQGDVYIELYLAAPDHGRRVGLHRNGTRVIEDLAQIEVFQRPPWTEGWLEGLIDAPFLNLTPGTRTGIVHDEALESLRRALEPIEEKLHEIIAEQKRAEEERASHEVLKTIRRAFREALMALPAEEYDWFDLHGKAAGAGAIRACPAVDMDGEAPDEAENGYGQKRFFEFAGPLFSVRVSPASCVVPVGQSRPLRAIPRDSSRRLVEEGLSFEWRVIEGEGCIEHGGGELATFVAGAEPCLVRVHVRARQGDIECEAESVITVTDSLLPEPTPAAGQKEGLPGYTFRRAPGELWRSRYERDQNVIVINNAHRDYVYASRNKALKLRYICRLFAKELVLKNFPGFTPDQLLERMIELSLYTEENLK